MYQGASVNAARLCKIFIWMIPSYFDKSGGGKGGPYVFLAAKMCWWVTQTSKAVNYCVIRLFLLLSCLGIMMFTIRHQSASSGPRCVTVVVKMQCQHMLHFVTLCKSNKRWKCALGPSCLFCLWRALYSPSVSLHVRGMLIDHSHVNLTL